MSGKKILYKDDARKALMNGMNIMVEAVSVTLGPKGRNVVLERKYGSPQIINDGVTIAREIELADNIQNTGVSLIRQAASKTNDVAGDGTTTATVLAYAMVREGMRNLTAGANPISLKIGMEKALQFLIANINEYSKPVEDLKAISQVAAISAGNDNEIGQMIASALDKVGKDGVISLEEGKSTTIELEISEGMRFEKGFISPYFITNPERMEVVFDNPYILITDKKISLVKQDLIPTLEQVARTKRSLLIIAADVEKEALTTLILNKLRNIINVAAVRAPSFGQRRRPILEDIAILTEGQVITEETGLSLENFNITQLGQARRVIITKDDTTIVNEGTEKLVQQQCENLRKQIKVADDNYQKEQLQDRIAKLSGGVAVIKVGAVTETEMKDKKLRLEDAINATRAAVEEGIVPGGGTMFVHLAENLRQWAKLNLHDDELIGALILSKAIKAPLRRIVENAGKNAALIMERIEQEDFNIGYNAALDIFGDMYELGIIDPAKVSRSALQNATSIAGMILTTECIVVNK
uniref:Chaperonin GroEL, chloroplastic n=1 Tax=Pseudopedinella elastica TaxID=35684 RepID=A0A516ZAF0_9STRA|nr:molecular chaperone GroEL [Pseudopedinella elastica]QDR24670.1 molecular chaperone GroEL [Pseudopedinella elastica]